MEKGADTEDISVLFLFLAVLIFWRKQTIITVILFDFYLFWLFYIQNCFRSFWHQQISDSSFRFWDIAIRIFCDEHRGGGGGGIGYSSSWMCAVGKLQMGHHYHHHPHVERRVAWIVWLLHCTSVPQCIKLYHTVPSCTKLYLTSCTTLYHCISVPHCTKLYQAVPD